MQPKFKVGEKVLTHPGPYQAVGEVATVLGGRAPGEPHQYVVSFNDNCMPGSRRYHIFEEDRLLHYEDPLGAERQELQDEISTLKARVDNLIDQNDALCAENQNLIDQVDYLNARERRIRSILNHDSDDPSEAGSM